ncbi:hypothetical protein [Azospirillum sp. SYSU D00513]|uniref:hypothetical protein n=1 Tax=Azospirillum sp. SYSU D00513 TaxID=2812561 RepID=UPI001A95E2DD|nr:hypothetical protein [Azospirillum sp. SYSU D00513]
MNPANQAQAAEHARKILEEYLLQHPAEADPQSNLDRAAEAGDVIWRRWQVGPSRWQVKHIRWYLETGCRDRDQSDVHAAWKTFTLLAEALGKTQNWRGHLNGRWTKPEVTATVDA